MTCLLAPAAALGASSTTVAVPELCAAALHLPTCAAMQLFCLPSTQQVQLGPMGVQRSSMHCCVEGKPALFAGRGWSVRAGTAALASLSLKVRSNSASTCRAPFTRHTIGRSSR